MRFKQFLSNSPFVRSLVIDAPFPYRANVERVSARQDRRLDFTYFALELFSRKVYVDTVSLGLHRCCLNSSFQMALTGLTI
jgi:hypothetical protein